MVLSLVRVMSEYTRFSLDCHLHFAPVALWHADVVVVVSDSGTVDRVTHTHVLRVQ